MEEQPGTEGVRGVQHDALYEFVLRHAGAEHDTSELDAAAAVVLDELAEAGAEALLLKGPALRALLYGGSQHRSYSDIDLLIAPLQLDLAREVLARLGYTSADEVQGVDHIGGNVHAETWIATNTDSVWKPMIDLHWTLFGARAAPEVVWRALWGRSTEIELHGRRAAVPDRAGLALHLALHAAQHGPGFDKHLGELSLALARWPHEVWGSAATLAEDIGALVPFAAGLRLVSQGEVVASDLGLPSSAEAEWTIEHRDRRPRGTFHLRAFAEARGPAERVSVVRRSLFPRRAWIAYEYPWARGGRLRLAAGYCAHLLRAPAWGARAWRFTRRARRSAR